MRWIGRGARAASCWLLVRVGRVRRCAGGIAADRGLGEVRVRELGMELADGNALVAWETLGAVYVVGVRLGGSWCGVRQLASRRLVVSVWAEWWRRGCFGVKVWFGNGNGRFGL
jgi:hypothetical protein